jgi:hypothetical protein
MTLLPFGESWDAERVARRECVRVWRALRHAQVFQHPSSAGRRRDEARYRHGRSVCFRGQESQASGYGFRVTVRLRLIIDHFFTLIPADFDEEESLKGSSKNDPTWWSIASKMPTELSQGHGHLLVARAR